MSSSSDEELIVRNPYVMKANDQRRSNRRSHISRDQETKIRALEEMKRARESGGVHRVDVANLVKPVYEEVDEEEYMKIVRQRQDDDFVVDDDGSGYIDHGVDFFYEDEVGNTTTNSKKPKEKKDKMKRKAINDFFHTASSKRTEKDEDSVTLANDPDVEALLNECELSSCLKKFKPDETADSKMSMPSIRNRFLRDPNTSMKFEPTSISEKMPCIMNMRHDNMTALQSITSPIEAQQNSVKLSAAFFDEDELVNENAVSQKQTLEHMTIYEDTSESKPSLILNDATKSITAEEVEPAVLSLDWADSKMTESQKVGQSITVDEYAAVDSFMRTNADGKSVLRFYWLDAFEDPFKMPGTVYLFGRLINKGASESCCVVVKNIWRQIFFLPREKRLINQVQTDENVDLLQVNDEVQKVLRSLGVKIVKCKPCEKKFAYNDGIIPQSAQVLEVHYSFSNPRLPVDLSGETFSYVFNTTTTAMERLLIEADMKGPSWIEISDCAISSPQVSYVDHEFVVDMERMKSITVINCTDPLPEMKLLTLNIVTSVNEKKETEIVLISCVLDRKCSTENPTLDRNCLERFCILTKPNHFAYPFDLKSKLEQFNMETVVFETMNERHMLNHFLCKLQNLDPDIYAGHDLSAQFAVLSSRLEKLKIAHWSRLGRLKRSVAIKQATHSKTSQWELTAGRLVLDSRLAAMELVRMRSYDLYELSSSLLGINQDVAFKQNIASHFASSKQLIGYINATWMEAWLSLAVIVELNALPLYIQITQIVGGVLSRTMMGGRAERNEYLLLHAFKKAGYVAPNKYQPDFKKKKRGVEDSGGANDDENGDRKVQRNRKVQYVGGLVLDPKIGLYDTFVLLLDFNSLYPSIIQEYNICFTTVDQSKKGEYEIPELPSDTNEGILPREIRVLVERRREVKKLIALGNLTEQQKQQYEIRQMALKLTANSMYGCLGFQQSRFYAKSLAALITARGREILAHTKDLIEKSGYSVIYGDTDSVMINTGLLGWSQIEQVKKLSNDIRKLINKCHKKLEIDVDGIFMKLLLLKKKKYAGLVVDLSNGNKIRREIKGLDIVRRDYSFIAKQIGNEILDIILSTEAQGYDEVTEQIYNRLQKLGEEIVQGLVETSKFQILKQLTRNLDDYADINVQPHASVARRLNATGNFKFHQGDTVAYIICEDGKGKSPVQRAYHISELQANADLKIDIQYYLAQQIHPVVSRLCVPIEGCSEAWVAQALGIDDTPYRRRAAVHNEMGQEDQFYSWYNFDNCESFNFICPNDGCTHEFRLRECFIRDDNDSGLKLWLNECSSCHYPLLSFGAYLNNQLHLALDKAVSDYYRSSYVCDDTGCAHHMRTLVLAWTREGIPCPRCNNGLMRKEFSSKALYEQLIFYRTLFDVTKAMENCTEEEKMKLQAGSSWKETTVLLDKLLSLCDQYIADNQYNRVSLSYLFAAMRPL